MKKSHHSTTLTWLSWAFVSILVAFMFVSTISASSPYSASFELGEVRTNSVVLNDEPLLIMCKDNGNSLYYNGYSASMQVTGHILSQYDDNSTCFEWYLCDEGNSQYSIRYGNSNYYLTYTAESSGSIILSVELVSSSLENKHKWTLDYSTNDNVIGNSISTKIKNVANGRYIYCDDSGGVYLGLYPNSNYYQWNFDNKNGREILTGFTVNYNRWMEVAAVQEISVSSYPQNAFWATFPDHFEVESLDTSIVTVLSDKKTIQGVSTGSTLLDIRHTYSGATYRVPITVGQIINNGTYYISNRQSGRFVTVSGASLNENVNIVEQAWLMKDYQSWVINYEGNGYYSVKSKLSNKYLSVSSPTFIYGNTIEQSSTLTDASLWRIINTSQGAYAFYPKCSESSGLVMSSTSSNTDGQVLQQLADSNLFVHYDEWYLCQTHASYLYTSQTGYDIDLYYNIMNVNSERYLCAITNGDIIDVYTSQNCDATTNIWGTTYLSTVMGIKTIELTNLGIEASFGFNDNYSLNWDGSDLTLEKNASQGASLRRINLQPYDGTYVIMYSGKYLAEDPGTHEVYYTNDFSESCIWSLRISGGKTANLFDFNDSTQNAYTPVNQHLSLCGFSVIEQREKTPQDAYEILPNTKIFIFRGHGTPGNLHFNNKTLSSYGSNSNGNYSILTYEDNELASLQMAFYLACQTGVKPRMEATLQNLSVDKGAHFALATFDTVMTGDGNDFISYMMAELSSGESVKAAMKKTQQKLAEREGESIPLYHYNAEQPYYPIIYCGDIYQKIS